MSNTEIASARRRRPPVTLCLNHHSWRWSLGQIVALDSRFVGNWPRDALPCCSLRETPQRRAAAKQLGKVGRVEPLPLDVADANSINDAATEARADTDRLDFIINNAGINYDTWETVENADVNGTVTETIATDLLGPWRLCQAFLPLLRKSQAGRIVNVSSESGSLAEMGAGPPAYQVTKAALNAMTRTLAGELCGAHILVNAACPGWVATDMGGTGAPRSVSEGATGIVWAATLPDDGPTGGFFRDGKPLPW